MLFHNLEKGERCQYRVYDLEEVMEKILLTGVPGVGKTTVVQRVLSKLSINVGGFYTQEMREGASRMGFRIISTKGKVGLLAHIHFQSQWKVGTYRVNVEDIDRVGVKSLEQALRESDLIVIDEIGKMELFSKRFRRAVLQCLDSPKNIFGTLQMSKNHFLDAIRSREDVRLIRVTAANRDVLPEEIYPLFLHQST